MFDHIKGSGVYASTTFTSAYNSMWHLLNPQFILLTNLKNVFTEKLGQFNFNPHQMLVVDLMHEFELGVWKSTLIHIICVLYAAAHTGEAVMLLNARLVFSIHLDLWHSKSYCLKLQGFGKFQLLAKAQFVASFILSQR
jgi:hypothetical protein